MGLNPLILLSTIVTVTVCFLSWGLAHDLATLVIFSLLFGFFAYGFSSMRARMGTTVSEEPTAALATFGILLSIRVLEVFSRDPSVRVFCLEEFSGIAMAS